MDQAELIDYATALGSKAKPGSVFALVGDLGAGKTHFTKGLAAGLGMNPNIVTSPTFTLVHEYTGGRIPLHHFDFYRLESEDEALAIGWDEYVESGAVLAVEWPDKFPDLLPAHARWIRILILPGDARQITESTSP